MIELFVMEIRRSKKAESEMRARVLAGLCVCGCGRKAGENAKLGLSRHCYYMHREAKKGLTKRQEQAYEGRLVGEGRLLQSHEIRRIKSDNVFLRAAKSVAM